MKIRRKYFIFYSIIAMIISLFFSRAGLSLCMVIFSGACIIHTRIKDQLRVFLSTPLLWSMSLLFILPLLSGIWSTDKQEWLQTLIIKLPLIIFSFAFAFSFGFSEKQWRGIAILFVLLVTAGTLWSMYHYLVDMQAVHEEYLHARTMVTPLENDHVRFSWLISLSILIAASLWWQSDKQTKLSWLYILLITWLIAFLHILAARTGLLSFYVAVIMITVRSVFKNKRWIWGVGFLAGIIVLPLLSWFLFPTFQNRVRYFQYDFQYFKDAKYLPGGNDATRVISMRTGSSIILEHPLTGTGFGDIVKDMNEAYSISNASMQEKDKIKPSSEWLIYGVGAGIPGVLLFTFCLIAPFLISVKKQWEWQLLNILVAASFLFDIGLEIQFGVFIYCFTVLAAWKWFTLE